MKKRFIIVFALIFSIFISYQSVDAAQKIDNYDINMKVEESGIIKVNQKIKVNFGEEERHGIFVNIPEKYRMNWNGVKKEYFFPVSNISVKKHNYEVIREGEGTQIKIGDQDTFVSGIVEYEYSYTITTKDLGLDGRQMLYFNIVGSGWEFPISNINYTIVMPKEFTQTPKVFDSKGPVPKSNFQVNGKTITGREESLNAFEALTIQLELDDNYFVFGSTNGIQYIINAISIFITGLCIYFFLKYGRDKKVIPIIQFKPPSGMSSAQVGYVVDGSLQQKDITSLIVYWASKKYLTITEEEKNIFSFKKLKDPDASELAVEVAIFNSLFEENDKVISNKIPDSYSKAIMNIHVDMADYYKKDRAIFTEKSTGLQIVMGVLASLILGVFLAVNAYLYSYRIFYMVSGLVVLVIGIIIMILITNILTQTKLRSKAKTFGLAIVVIIISIILSLIYLVMSYIFEVSLISAILMIALFFVSCLFIAFMGSRTNYGHQLLEEILGFREFMIHAEKERLEMFVKETPTFFYDILPYAYVLGVSDVWIKNFENIKMVQPDWYVSSSPLTNLYIFAALNSSLNHMNTAAITSAAGGSGGFGGGGGGFSGGGFGGGGGGSW